MRFLDLLTLGRMAEKAITSDEPVFLKSYGEGTWLRVDGEWPLTPSQARLVRRLRAERVNRNE